MISRVDSVHFIPQ